MQKELNGFWRQVEDAMVGLGKSVWMLTRDLFNMIRYAGSPFPPFASGGLIRGPRRRSADEEARRRISEAYTSIAQTRPRLVLDEAEIGSTGARMEEAIRRIVDRVVGDDYTFIILEMAPVYARTLSALHDSDFRTLTVDHVVNVARAQAQMLLNAPAQAETPSATWSPPSSDAFISLQDRVWRTVVRSVSPERDRSMIAEDVMLALQSRFSHPSRVTTHDIELAIRDLLMTGRTRPATVGRTRDGSTTHTEVQQLRIDRMAVWAEEEHLKAVRAKAAKDKLNQPREGHAHSLARWKHRRKK